MAKELANVYAPPNKKPSRSRSTNPISRDAKATPRPRNRGSNAIQQRQRNGQSLQPRLAWSVPRPQIGPPKITSEDERADCRPIRAPCKHPRKKDRGLCRATSPAEQK